MIRKEKMNGGGAAAKDGEDEKQKANVSEFRKKMSKFGGDDSIDEEESESDNSD
jgi:hypothetical protein